jgi:hypothetical protein
MAWVSVKAAVGPPSVIVTVPNARSKAVAPVQAKDGEKGPPRVSGGEVTNFRKNQFVGEYHQSKVAIVMRNHIDEIPAEVQQNLCCYPISTLNLLSRQA